MNTSDIINLILAIATIILSITSIVIVIISLNQNSKMLESTTRPYINIYGTSTFYSKEKDYYFVIKNFGNSSGKITSIISDEDLSKLAIKGFASPFSFIDGLVLSPNQSYQILVDHDALREINKDCISVTITYEGLGKTYRESTAINIKYLLKNINVRTDSDPIGTISGVIQDISNRNL